MTWRRWRVPLFVATCAVLMGIALSQLPDRVADVVRLANGFVIVSLMAWVIRRVLRYEALLLAHREEIRELMAQAEASRTEAVEGLMVRSKELASAALHIAHKNKRESEERHEEMGRKLDEILERKKQEGQS